MEEPYKIVMERLFNFLMDLMDMIQPRLSILMERLNVVMLVDWHQNLMLLDHKDTNYFLTYNPFMGVISSHLI